MKPLTIRHADFNMSLCLPTSESDNFRFRQKVVYLQQSALLVNVLLQHPADASL